MLDAVQLKLLFRAAGWVSLLLTIPAVISNLLGVGSFVIDSARVEPTMVFIVEGVYSAHPSPGMEFSLGLVSRGLLLALISLLPIAPSIYLCRGASWIVRSVSGNGVKSCGTETG